MCILLGSKIVFYLTLSKIHITHTNKRKEKSKVFNEKKTKKTKKQT